MPETTKSLTFTPEELPSVERIPMVRQNDEKDTARLTYQASVRRQDHGSRQGAKGHIRDSYIANGGYLSHRRGENPEDVVYLRDDGWTTQDQAAADHDYFMRGIYEDDLDFHEPQELTEPDEEFVHIESRRALAEVLLGQLEQGEIDKQEAWFLFEAGTGLFEDRLLHEQEAEELQRHFAYSGRMAAARTLDYTPLEDVDYLDGFTIQRF